MAYDFTKLKGQIKETEEWLTREFSSIRTGRASISLLDSVKPDAYGTRSPISQVASLTIEDARTIRVIPWDKTLVKAIEKAVSDADIGVSAVVDDAGLRVVFPELTAERRTMLIKLAGEKLEHARVTLRGHRTDTIRDLEKTEKDGGMGEDELKRLKDEVQKMIDVASVSLEAMLKKKQEEITM